MPNKTLDLQREEHYLELLLDSVEHPVAAEFWEDPHFIEVLGHMERKEPFVLSKRGENEELHFKYRLPAWECILQATVFVRVIPSNDFVETAKWIQMKIRSIRLCLRFKSFIQYTVNEMQSLGLRFSTSRLAEETDVSLWWNDDKINQEAEDDMKKLRRGLIAVITSRISQPGSTPSEQKTLH